MAQGFGREPKKLGYVLLLLPEVHAYAASASLPEFGEDDFFGITNTLKRARRWRKQRSAEQAIFEYLNVFEDKVAENGTHMVIIERLDELPNGELRTSVERKVDLSRQLVG